MSQVPNINHYSFLNSKSFKCSVTAPIPKNVFMVEDIPTITSIVELPESPVPKLCDLSKEPKHDNFISCDTLGMFQSFAVAVVHIMTS